MNPVIETYSRLADEYDGDNNIHSCWGTATSASLTKIKQRLKERFRVVVDVGCGTGRELLHLASTVPQEMQLIGLEPAAMMRQRAIRRVSSYPNIRILDGSFEAMPLETGSVDYLYSILAFHWTTDLEKAVSEIARVLNPTGEMDLFFIGRNNGQEFIKNTSAIFLKYMGLASWVAAAKMRKQLVQDEALELFRQHFDSHDLQVEESYVTYYDTLEGHWSWWVRIEGQFLDIPEHKKAECDRAVKDAISSLDTDEGIPYTIHLLHVKISST